MSFAMSAAAASLAAATGLGVPTSSTVVSHGLFQSPGGHHHAPHAVTFDRSAVPEHSRVGATERAGGPSGGTRVALRVHGIQPHRSFGAHVHQKPCGTKPDDSGPHYQNRVDPAATPDNPSTNPDYANPDNEVWLDLTTDKFGNAQSSSTVDWRFRNGEARSVVIHEHPTHTGEGHAGEAGDRLACLNVRFKH